jgi:hypothetical protein
MSLHTTVQQQLLAQLGDAAPAAGEQVKVAQLNNALRLISKWRSVLIQNTVLQHQGTTVWQGPPSSTPNAVSG